MPEPRYTLPGTKLPEGSLPPTLLFHRWPAYDRFEREMEQVGKKRVQKDPFTQQEVKFAFLSEVSTSTQNVCFEQFQVWHTRFARACAKVGAETPLVATTLWRLVVGWGTNPAFVTGLTLDHFLGFPFIPGSAVKGLLHRMAEQELLEQAGSESPIPEAHATLPTEPPPELTSALLRALRLRALFGSLHLKRNQKTDPEAPFDRLTAWRALLPEPGKEPSAWTETRRQLAHACSDAPAGGMVTCFDAVPATETFSQKDRPALTADVLTPHGDSGTNPILFLSVREGVAFELRYRLAAWPAEKPRDDEERQRSADLAGISRQTVATELRRWLVRGLAELGLGGKTSAGYGYLLAKDYRGAIPRLLEAPPLPAEPKEQLSEAELLLPDEIPSGKAIEVLDKLLKDPDPAKQALVAARFKSLFPDLVAGWRAHLRPVNRKRAEAIDRLTS